MRIGENHRSQLRFGDGALIVADVRGDRRPSQAARSPMRWWYGWTTPARTASGPGAHGARILTEPTDFEYGERQYHAEDPFGHQWTFSETLADIAPNNGAGKQPGRKRQARASGFTLRD